MKHLNTIGYQGEVIFYYCRNFYNTAKILITSNVFNLKLYTDAIKLSV